MMPALAVTTSAMPSASVTNAVTPALRDVFLSVDDVSRPTSPESKLRGGIFFKCESVSAIDKLATVTPPIKPMASEVVLT